MNNYLACTSSNATIKLPWLYNIAAKMSKRICLTVDQVLESILCDRDDEEMEDLDDPGEPLLEGSDDDFEDLYDDKRN